MDLLVFLPTLNACLNSTCAVLLILGFIAIKKNNPLRHRAFMVGATICSVLFLSSYLYYHSKIGSKHFTGTGWVRPVYFSILISHTVLAAVIVPMILRTLWLAGKKDFQTHKKWARLTWPLWIFVSVTGVVIYWMLYC